MSWLSACCLILRAVPLTFWHPHRARKAVVHNVEKKECPPRRKLRKYVLAGRSPTSINYFTCRRSWILLVNAPPWYTVIPDRWINIGCKTPWIVESMIPCVRPAAKAMHVGSPHSIAVMLQNAAARAEDPKSRARWLFILASRGPITNHSWQSILVA